MPSIKLLLFYFSSILEIQQEYICINVWNKSHTEEITAPGSDMDSGVAVYSILNLVHRLHIYINAI